MTFKHPRALFLITMVAAAGYASAASAGVAECKKIEAPLDRLACFDRLTSRAAAGLAQPAKQPDLTRANVPSQAMAAYTKAKPYEPASRWWVEAEQGFYGLSRGHAPALVVTGNRLSLDHS